MIDYLEDKVDLLIDKEIRRCLNVKKAQKRGGIRNNSGGNNIHIMQLRNESS
mgnify:CR=1 FL=1